MAQIGFVGTGTMGGPIAGHLLAAGHTVRVFDRSPTATAPLVEQGAVRGTSAADAADGSACVLLSLPGPTEVDDAVTGADGVLQAGTLPRHVVDLSTNSVAAVRRLHTCCAEAGVGFVDAPVSGGLPRARSGTLSVMAGGAEDDLEAVGPYLSCFAEQVFAVGPPGTGTIAKLVNNQIFLGAAVLVQEAYVAAAAAGVDPAALHPILKASSAGTYISLAPLLLGRAFDDVVFRLDIAAKDLSVAVESAHDAGVGVPTTEAALAVYRAAVEAGMGGEVFHATLKELERRAGVELPPLRRGGRS